MTNKERLVWAAVLVIVVVGLLFFSDQRYRQNDTSGLGFPAPPIADTNRRSTPTAVKPVPVRPDSLTPAAFSRDRALVPTAVPGRPNYSWSNERERRRLNDLENRVFDLNRQLEEERLCRRDPRLCFR